MAASTSFPNHSHATIEQTGDYKGGLDFQTGDKLMLSDLKERLHYNPDTGNFTWVSTTSNRVKIGSIAGTRDRTNGYIKINIGGKQRYAHRLAFLYMEGAFPPDMVDHINGVRDDNRWCNLRHATRSQNAANKGSQSNNKSGVPGVKVAPSGRWEARVKVNGKVHCIGTFDTKEEARRARNSAANDAFGEYARAV